MVIPSFTSEESSYTVFIYSDTELKSTTINMKNKMKGKTYGFQKGNVPHNRGVTSEKESKDTYIVPRYLRLNTEEYELYTHDAQGAKVDLPNAKLLRPKVPPATVPELNSSKELPRYFFFFYLLSVCFIL